MELKTESGVSVSLTIKKSSMIILFDKPVRAFELKKGEIAKISSFLASNTCKKIKNQSQNISEEGYSCIHQNGK